MDRIEVQQVFHIGVFDEDGGFEEFLLRWLDGPEGFWRFSFFGGDDQSFLRETHDQAVNPFQDLPGSTLVPVSQDGDNLGSRSPRSKKLPDLARNSIEREVVAAPQIHDDDRVVDGVADDVGVGYLEESTLIHGERNLQRRTVAGPCRPISEPGSCSPARDIDRRLADTAMPQEGPDTSRILTGPRGVRTQALPSHSVADLNGHALTQLSIDHHNRIRTSDSRLLRRLVRDRRYRNIRAEETIRRWPKVRTGEKKHIFPFQENSDAMFNSALAYETAVLKNFAERYLLEIPADSPSQAKGYQLRRFLDLFVPLWPDYVPHISLLREFIGGSDFSYK
jgi:hypothetical protein